MFAVCMLAGGDVSEKAASVSGELSLACFLVICECTSMLLKFIFLFCDDGSDNW